MKLTWKTKTSTTTACPCHDPIVFGHAPPCPRWETRNNDGPPKPAGLPYAEFGNLSMQASSPETTRAMQRFGRTVEQFYVLMRELNEANDLMREAIDATDAPDRPSPPNPPAGPV